MSIVRGCKLAGVLSLLSIVMLIVCVVQVFRGVEQLKSAEESRYRSALLAQEVRILSEGLTSNARFYVSTGNEDFEKTYWYLADVQTGATERPQNSLIAPGEKIDLLDLMKNSGFTPQEMQFMETSVNISNIQPTVPCFLITTLSTRLNTHGFFISTILFIIIFNALRSKSAFNRFRYS